MDLIKKYFPELSAEQLSQFEQLGTLYPEWNAKINVISRKDIDNLYPNHILHSLVLAKFLGPLVPGTSFIDLGTGGGFPGVPLAIYYPECKFHLIDRIGKKIKVAQEISAAIGLKNVTFQHGDIKECKQKVNYVVSRAVMPLNDLEVLVRKCFVADPKPYKANRYAPGLICLKGSDIAKESEGITRTIADFPVAEFIPESHFESKSIVYIPFGK